MRPVLDALVNELRILIEDLGTHGGLMSPSIYDTAQVLRLAPPDQGVEAGLAWLIDQQQSDGGWGDCAVPLARTATTLAAVLAVAHYCEPSHASIAAGLRFLANQASIWDADLPDDLPAGVELLVPHLADELAARGMEPPSQYASLRALGAKRKALFKRITVLPGTTIAHSWEAWGVEPDPDLIDDAGSIGHSPAATAAWLHASAGREDLSLLRVAARRYLDQAAAVIGAGVPGVVPTAWPITRFEQAFSLYILCVANLATHPTLAPPIASQVRRVSAAMGPRGLGYSDWFAPDGDDTAAMCAALAVVGMPARLDALAHFAFEDHYCAWQGEMQAATSVTSHAIHALWHDGQPYDEPLAYMLRQQQPDGRWVGDKWNRSWVYTTGQALIALASVAPEAVIVRGVAALLAGQLPCGAWGTPEPSGEETAYATLALRVLVREHGLPLEALNALERAETWLKDPARVRDGADVAYWLAKVPYRPARLARICELSAELVAHEAPIWSIELEAHT